MSSRPEQQGPGQCLATDFDFVIDFAIDSAIEPGFEFGFEFGYAPRFVPGCAVRVARQNDQPWQ